MTYIRELYDDEDGSAEVSAAITKMKERKAPGIDEILAEWLKALNDVNMVIRTDLCNKI